MADELRITNKKALGLVEREDGTFEYLEYIEGFAKSTVEKPTKGIAQGSWIFETNTKKVKFFDEGTRTWG